MGKRWWRRGLVAVLAAVGIGTLACGGSGTSGLVASSAAGATPAEPQASEEAVSGPFLPSGVQETSFGAPIIREETSVPGYGRGWGTNWNIRLIDLGELLSGGPPRDGIPALDAPTFISVAEANALYQDNSPVVHFALNGDARAYPLAILIWHEIVNDVFSGVPVTVTFCPLCNTAIVFDRRIGDHTFDFGTSGLLRNSDLVMYDRQTESLWQQIGGDAIVGDMVGARLTFLPAAIVSWAQFKESFPDGRVLSQDTGFRRDYGSNPYTGYDNVDNPPFLFRGELDGRLSPNERVVTLDLGAEAVAYPFPLLEQVRVLKDTRDGAQLVLFWTPGTSSALDSANIDRGREVGATGVFRRDLNGQLLSFRPNPDDPETFLDQETGSIWDIFGHAVSGPLVGSDLTPVVHANHFWFSWAAFRPDTIIVTR